MNSAIQELLVAGTLMDAQQAAFITKSLTDILVPETALSFALIFIRLSTPT